MESNFGHLVMASRNASQGATVKKNVAKTGYSENRGYDSTSGGYISCPLSETWFWGMSVGGSFRRAKGGVILERCNQLAVFATRSVG